MRSRAVMALVVATAWSVGLLAASYTFTSTWKAPGTGPLNFAGKKVAALAITTDDGLRMSAEEALAREITARGPQGVAAYRLIPREELTDTILAVETLLYNVADAKLLWAGVSETTNPKDVGTFMKGLAATIVKELQKQGLARKAPK